MNIIEINESNYQSYTNLDIAAFSFAYEGAMGEGGGIYIIDKAGQIYHANYFMADQLILFAATATKFTCQGFSNNA